MKHQKEKVHSKYYLPLLFLFISTMLMSIGYASINSITAEIDGVAIAKTNIQTGVYVSNYKLLSVTSANAEEQIINYYYGTLINGNITLSDANSSVTYTVEVTNNSSDVYKFDGIKYDSGFFDSENFKVEYEDIELGDRLNANEIKSFKITFTYKDGKAPVDTLNYYINTSFIKLEKYTITYNNIDNSDTLISSIIEDDPINVTLPNSPKNIKVTMDGKELVQDTDYTYIDGVLTITKVTGNVVISKETSGSILPEGNDLTVVIEKSKHSGGDSDGKYSYTIMSITNTRDEVAKDWVIYIKVPDDFTLTQTPYGESSASYENGILTIRKLSWSKDIESGGALTWVSTFEFTTQTPESEFYPFEVTSIINP